MDAIVKGEGKVLLMLHGYLSKKEYFEKQINYFSKFYKVIAVDFLGFNNDMEYPYSLDDYKCHINRLIQSLNGEKVDILAHSFGARVAIKLMAEPNNIDKVVLTGPAGLKPRFSLKKKLAILRYKLAKIFLSEEKLSAFGSSDYKMLSPIQKRSFVKIVNEHLDGLLEKIPNNVLIVCGDMDKETPLYMARRMHKLIKHSHLEIIKGAGHFAFLEKPNEFNILVKEFLL